MRSFWIFTATPGSGVGVRRKDALRQVSARGEAVICLLSPNWEASSEVRPSTQRAPRRLRQHGRHAAAVARTGPGPKLLSVKLTMNMSHKQWNLWVSPQIGYIEVCPGLPVPRHRDGSMGNCWRVHPLRDP